MDLVTIVLPALGSLALVAIATALCGRLAYRHRVVEAHRTGVWFGIDEPPAGFRGHWRNGRASQVWPLTVGTTSLTAEQIADLEED